MNSPQQPVSSEDLQSLHAACERLRAELSKTIVGQSEVINELLVSLLAGGHSLLVGVPGLAKTLLVHSLAQVLGLSFNRIQFTPDLMPADITGTEVIQEDRQTGVRDFRFIRGPIFANIVLADEINRTPPKTQSALLEAMQEQHVTVGGVRHTLPHPFLVLATENPIEHQGTYPLPEAQLDRFMLEIRFDYPSEDEELQIVVRRKEAASPLSQILDIDELQKLQQVARAVPMAEHDIRYAVALVRATRIGTPHCPAELAKYLTWGAGPRASEWLVLAATAYAAVTGHDVATAHDIRAMASAVLRHRLVTNFNARAEGISSSDLVSMLIDHVPGPGSATKHSALKQFMTG